jgi:LacI family transcriptional regulator
MARKRTTLKQVAAKAGVSPTTASFVMNDVEGSNISEATRERVQAVARELGYVASAAARSLVSGRTQTIGMVLCQADLLLVDRFVPALLYGLNQVARERDYHVLVEGIDDVGSDDAYHELVRARGIDGLIVLDPRRGDAALARLIRDGFPVVTLGEVPGEDPYRVVSADRGGMRRATEHLIDLGHRRIAHLPFSPVGFAGTDDRLAGYRDALEAAELPFDPDLIEEVAYSAESGAAALTRLLTRERSFTAVTCGNDTVALGAMAALDAAGLRVPEDVAVVGFDDLPIAPYMRPPLTTVRSTPVESGREAMRILASLIDGDAPAERLVRMPSALIVRRSCGAPP